MKITFTLAILQRITHTERNFYGVSQITQDKDLTYFEHGSNIHGLQRRSGDNSHLTTYYALVDALFSSLPNAFFTRPRPKVSYLNLTPLIAKVAETTGFSTYRLEKNLSPERLAYGEQPSIWIALLLPESPMAATN
jgi:hypothetical protein